VILDCCYAESLQATSQAGSTWFTGTLSSSGPVIKGRPVAVLTV
jgi:hypothetical protein